MFSIVVSTIESTSLSPIIKTRLLKISLTGLHGKPIASSTKTKTPANKAAGSSKRNLRFAIQHEGYVIQHEGYVIQYEGLCYTA